MARQIFSKAALEKLSTPEKLDQLIKIVSVKSWLVLATIGLFLGTAIFWSISGRIKTKLSATGVLLGGEVYNIVSNTNGQ
ncbi:MAG: NHLP bacteriocin system secretion protein, partial [Bacteroidota bacterium]